MFIEAKWLYNDILSSDDLKNYNTKTKQVNVLNKEKEIESRDFTVLGGQIKQSIHQRIWSSIKSLSTKKKNGRNKEVGKLKLKSKVTSIPLKQFGATYKFNKNRLKIQGCKKTFLVKGLKQIPDNSDIANANLIKKPSGYYLKMTCYLPKNETSPSKEVVGIDFGIKDDLTLSNGLKFKTKFPISRRIKEEQKRLSKKTKGSKNYCKQRQKLQLAYEKYNNKKKDLKNKIVSYLKNNYGHIAIQNENIKG